MNRGFLFFMVAGIIGGLIAIGMTILVFGDNVKNTENGFYEIYISSHSDYDSVKSFLVEKDIIKNIRSFDWVAVRMNYPNTIEGGRYIIPNYISNKSLVRMLRNGFQEQPVKLALSNIDSREELCRRVSAVLECDTASLSALLESDSLLSSYGLTVENGWGIVLSDTYQFNWDTDAAEFFTRMNREFNDYWNDERKADAERNGLAPLDVVILASIIEKESSKPDEYPKIAGVYLNRLQKGWPLQADPTVKFALQDPNIKRVLNVHLEVDSPYNTYKNAGLPPGPIGLPEKTSLEAILNASQHDFMYFCAKEDFSGYHVFAKTLQEHKKNARRYQRALNQNGIF